MKILVLGQKQSGKDEFALQLSKISKLKYTNTSLLAVSTFIFYDIHDKYGYKTVDECYANRDEAREDWAKSFSAYNSEDPSRFVKKVIEANDFYVGLRDINQAMHSLHLFDIVVWIDADARTGYKESNSYFSVTKDIADVIIDNNGTKDDFIQEIINFKNNYVL